MRNFPFLKNKKNSKRQVNTAARQVDAPTAASPAVAAPKSEEEMVRVVAILMKMTFLGCGRSWRKIRSRRRFTIMQ